MTKLQFASIQKLCAGYMDGRLKAEDSIVKRYMGDFTFDENDMDMDVDYI
jgi:hypothetical protein